MKFGLLQTRGGGLGELEPPTGARLRRFAAGSRKSMLEISPSAAEVIRSMVDPGTGIEGFRVALGPSDSPNGNAPSVGVVIAPASGPNVGDDTVTQAGVAIFVDPDVAPLVEDKVLDVAPVGADRLKLTLTDQP